MTKTASLVGSFLLGVACMYFTGNYIPNFASSAFAQQPPPINHPEGNLFTPKIPPARSLSEGNTNLDQTIYLDGINSRGDSFRNPTFVYGGGTFHLDSAKIEGNVGIQLIGAAANTVAFLAQFGMIGCQSAAKPAPQVDPNSPFIKRVSLTAPLNGNFLSPY